MAISRTRAAHFLAGLRVLFSNRSQILVDLLVFFVFLSWLVLIMLPFSRAMIKVFHVIQVVFFGCLAKDFVVRVSFDALFKFKLREKQFLCRFTVACFRLIQLNFFLFQFSVRNVVTLSLRWNSYWSKLWRLHFLLLRL